MRTIVGLQSQHAFNYIKIKRHVYTEVCDQEIIYKVFKERKELHALSIRNAQRILACL